MAFEPDRVQTITFDSYSTIVDVEAAERALAERVESPESVSRRWRSRSLMYTMVANHIDGYQPFYAMNRDALSYALAAHGIDLPEADREEILAVYHDLDVFDDVRDGIESLRTAGYEPSVLSNGDPEMLASMVDGAGIDDLIVETISADEIETFKPAVELYRHAAARTGTPISEIAHVSAGWFDVMGAQHAGMQGVRVDRKGNPWEPFDGTPDLTVESLSGLVTALES